MKKFLCAAFSLLMLLSLCACGASSQSAVPEAPRVGQSSYANEEMGFYAESEEAAAEEPSPQNDAAGPESQSAGEKIIYSSEITVESTEFEESRNKLTELIKKYGGYIESSSINDADFYAKSRGYSSCRSAEYTIRIPVSAFSSMSSDLSALGNVPYSRTYTENVSVQYYDTEARLRVYRAQEEKLIEMLEKAQSIDDILAIEAKLTDVRYEIESMQSRLENWDRRVSYSTIYLSLQEVQEYTDDPEYSISYGERLLRSFKDGLAGVGHFFKNLLLWFVGALPALVIIAVIVIAAVKLIKKRRAKKALKKSQKENKI